MLQKNQALILVMTAFQVTLSLIVSLDPAIPGPYSFELILKQDPVACSSVDDDEDSNRLTDMSWYVYK